MNCLAVWAAKIYATMKNMRIDRFFGTLLLLACSIAPAEAELAKATSAKPGDYENSIIVGSEKRSYLVHVPQGYNGQSLPVVIVFHGGLANAKLSQWNARMVEKGDKDQFFVVYPHGSNGIGKHLLTWNAGTCCGLASKENADDIGFVRALIDRLISEYAVDPARIFVTGMSNGGMMAYRVACELSDLVAAAAPVEGCMLSNTSMTATHPISIVAFNGTEDRVVPYSGGAGSFFGYKIKCPSAKDSIHSWAEHNHCYPLAQKEESGDVIKETYTGGDDGTEVCLYTLKAGHTWPGGRSKFPGQKATTTKFSATDAMCEFFWAHPKKSAK